MERVSDEYTVLLSAGTMLAKTETGWRPINEGLRDEVIKAALQEPHVDDVRQALRKRRPITFEDTTVGLTIRWTPGEVH